MSQLKTRIVPSPQTLRRNRLLLMAGIVTVLPTAAFAPSLLSHNQSKAPLLAAIDEMATQTNAYAKANEHAVRVAADWAKNQAAYASFMNIGARPQAASVASLALELEQATPHSELRWFNGRPIRPARTLSMTVTAYSPDEASCGESADGITASGYSVWTNGMKMVAADTSLLPFGTLVSIPGYDDASPVPVLDRGGAIKGHRLDLLYPTDAAARQWGVQRLNVTVWEYADGKPADFQTQYTASR